MTEKDFLEGNVSDKITDAMISLSKIAKMIFLMDKAKKARDTASEIKIRNDIQREITKAILTIFMISKDLDINVREALDEDSFSPQTH